MLYLIIFLVVFAAIGFFGFKELKKRRAEHPPADNSEKEEAWTLCN